MSRVREVPTGCCRTLYCGYGNLEDWGCETVMAVVCPDPPPPVVFSTRALLPVDWHQGLFEGALHLAFFLSPVFLVFFVSAHIDFAT